MYTSSTFASWNKAKKYASCAVSSTTSRRWFYCCQYTHITKFVILNPKFCSITNACALPYHRYEWSPSPSPSPSSSSSISSTYSPISNQQILKVLPEGKSDKGGTVNVTLEHCPQDRRTLGFRVEKDDVDSSQVGWPLLRRSTTMVKENTENLNSHRMSVIEWALQLPDRPKEKLNPQCLLPTREEQCRIISENISKDKTSPLNSSTIGTYPCDVNTITSKVALVCHNKTCREFHLLELQAATNNFSTSKYLYVHTNASFVCL